MKKIVIITLMLILTTLLLGCISNEPSPIGGDTDEGGCLIGAGYSYDEYVGACTRNWELNESQKNGAKLAVNFVGSQNGLVVIDVNVMKCVGCYIVELVNSSNEQKIIEIINFVPRYKDLNDSLEYNYYEGLVEDFVVVYNTKNETIDYSFVVNKPTPCYEVKHDVLLMESYPVQVVVNVDLIPLQTFAACAEVITPEKIFKSIDLNHVPGSFRINFNSEIIFTTNSIETGGICSQEQKDAEFCTMEYYPVCGDDGQTYGNACGACASGKIDYYLDGEC